MESLDSKHALYFALPALIVNKLLETGGYPSIVDVERVSPGLADVMSSLGYAELDSDLLNAYLSQEGIEAPEVDQISLLDDPSIRTVMGNGHDYSVKKNNSNG